MGYIRAEEILPEEIIALIQQYVDGTNIYIPRKQENRQEWGAKTAYRVELQDRNPLIYKGYLSGMINGRRKVTNLSQKSHENVTRISYDRLRHARLSLERGT